MTTGMKISIAAIAVLLAGSSITWASEPNDSGITLKFEVKSKEIGPLSPRRVQVNEAFGPWRPTYAAGIPFAGPTRYLSGPGSGWMQEFLHFALGEVLGRVTSDTHNELSIAQKEFLRATGGLLASGRRDGPIPQWYRPQDERNGSEQLLLYAVTLEDAKAMAQLYYQHAMNLFHSQIDTLDKLIGETNGKIMEEEKRISEIDELAQTTQKSLDELQKIVPYRTDSEAHEAIGELDRMLNAAQVESAGIRAKIAAIQGYQQEKRGGTNPEAATRLDMMFIEESVALRGVQARWEMATHLREQTNRFLDLKSALANAATEKEALTESLKGNRMNLTVARDQLKSARTDEPKIPDRVAIYPVEWAPADQGLGLGFLVPGGYDGYSVTRRTADVVPDCVPPLPAGADCG